MSLWSTNTSDVKLRYRACQEHLMIILHFNTLDIRVTQLYIHYNIHGIPRAYRGIYAIF